jgi:hypothetical protein
MQVYWSGKKLSRKASGRDLCSNYAIIENARNEGLLTWLKNPKDDYRS